MPGNSRAVDTQARARARASSWSRARPGLRADRPRVREARLRHREPNRPGDRPAALHRGQRPRVGRGHVTVTKNEILYSFNKPDDFILAIVEFLDAHAEYRHAKANELPVLAFIKGERQVKREDGTVALLAELDADGPKYKRFGNVIELQKEVRAALVKLLLERFGIAPTSDENLIAEQTIEATSAFESQSLTRVRWEDLDQDVARRLVSASEMRKPEELADVDLLAGATLRGLVWRDPSSGQHFATAAGIVLLARDPSAVFPQCRILADAYRSIEPDGDPRDHEDIRAPMPLAVERAMAFVDRNTRHPMRIVGLNRIRMDEYPMEALREGMVNAVAHRQYEDGGRKIMLEVFADRVVFSSPGLPPKPITLASLRKGKYRPCSRNPVLAQGLSYFHRIEERGSGFRRMADQMLNHGLDQPIIGTDTGYFSSKSRSRSKPSTRQRAREVDPPRAPEHAAPVVGAAAAGGGAGGDLRADGGRSVGLRGCAARDPKLKRKAEPRSRPA
jgi:predicted HTH transcriptional regulator